jgi:hypothetical protein
LQRFSPPERLSRLGPAEGRKPAIDVASAAVIYCLAEAMAVQSGVDMKTLAGLTTVILLGAATLAAAQVNIPNPTAPGMSPESAVRLVVNNDIMVDHYIQRWLRAHYPDWNAQPYELTEIGAARYAVVYISSTNEVGRKLYFRLQTHQMDDGETPWQPR